MTGKNDKRVLTAIQQDILRELHSVENQIYEMLDRDIAEMKFSAQKYKDEESYDLLLSSARAVNILKAFLKVMK